MQGTRLGQSHEREKVLDTEGTANCPGDRSMGSLVGGDSDQVWLLGWKAQRLWRAGLSAHVTSPWPRRETMPQRQDTSCENVSTGRPFFIGICFCLLLVDDKMGLLVGYFT